MSSPRWTPGIGDPTIMGWVTVAAYFGAAALCFVAARKRGDGRRIWRVLTVFLVALGINKQLDLQSWFTQVGRDMALHEGWYEWRGIVQREFVYAIIGLGVMATGVLFWITRRQALAVRVAVAGLSLLVAFIAVRASSFHHVDWFLGSTVFGVRFNWILELGGIGVIAGAASRYR